MKKKQFKKFVKKFEKLPQIIILFSLFKKSNLFVISERIRPEILESPTKLQSYISEQELKYGRKTQKRKLSDSFLDLPSNKRAKQSKIADFFFISPKREDCITRELNNSDGECSSVKSDVSSKSSKARRRSSSRASTSSPKVKLPPKKVKVNKKKEVLNEEYIVEKILKINTIEKIPSFLVKWKGYSNSDNTWEPFQHVRECKAFDIFIDGQLDVLKPSIESLEKQFDDENEIEEVTQNETDLLIYLNKNYDDKYYKCHLILLAYMVDKSKLNEKLTLKTKEMFKLNKIFRRRTNQLKEISDWEKYINSVDSTSTLNVENLFDFESPPTNFKYIKDRIPGEGVIIPDDPPIGCDCKDGCNFKQKNCCGKMSSSEFAYTSNKRLRLDRNKPIFECNKMCSCGPDCQNRVVQNGRKHSLCIFKTPNGCGWGVRTERTISEGQFITEYVGEVITGEEAENRGKIYDAQGRTYLFDLDFNDCKNEPPFTVDAAKVGNVSHFINHSCEPNLGVWPVWVNCLDPDLPRLCFFSLKRIEAGEELSFDYMNTVQKEQDESMDLELDQDIKCFCKCGSSNCRKYLF